MIKMPEDFSSIETDSCENNDKNNVKYEPIECRKGKDFFEQGLDLSIGCNGLGTESSAFTSLFYAVPVFARPHNRYNLSFRDAADNIPSLKALNVSTRSALKIISVFRDNGIRVIRWEQEYEKELEAKSKRNRKEMGME